MLHVDFLNKNTMRSYPLRADTSSVSQAGTPVPSSLFGAAQFSVASVYSKLAMNRIAVNGKYINILVSATKDNQRVYLGYFNGLIKTDYQPLPFLPIDPGVYGQLIIGRLEALDAFQGVHTFGVDDMMFEDSLVTYVVPPAVTSLLVGSKTLTGRVGLELSNVQRIVNPTDLQLDVVSKDSVRATGDLSAQFGNCPTNPIGSMNGVLPDEHGNIDIYGIAPVKVRVTPIGLTLDVQDVSRQELCAEDKRIPPLVAISTYLKDVTRAVVPEWKTWPQYTRP